MVVISVEEALLKSSSLFPYFMLVAFEAGGLFRAFLLLALPFLCLVSEETELEIMVLVCFFGVNTRSFRVGSAVLPKFFLEDAALETLVMLKKGGKNVVFNNIPRVMIESFLKDYLGIDCVVGREMKVFGGYFLGVMEDKKKSNDALETMTRSHDQIWLALVASRNHFNIICLLIAMKFTWKEEPTREAGNYRRMHVYSGLCACQFWNLNFFILVVHFTESVPP